MRTLPRRDARSMVETLREVELLAINITLVRAVDRSLVYGLAVRLCEPGLAHHTDALPHGFTHSALS
jgi:hypothetical protein